MVLNNYWRSIKFAWKYLLYQSREVFVHNVELDGQNRIG